LLIVRKLGFSLLLLGLALPGWSADRPGTISGYVRGASGIPQMGAVVEVLGAAADGLRVFTDENGFYSAAGLVPGMYNLKVSAPAFLPALREHIGLHSGTNIIVNITLNTLFEAIQIAPSRGGVDDDDWKWVLRSAANRSILRLDDPSNNQILVVESAKGDRELKGTLSFLAGSPSDGYGSVSDMSTGFSVEKSIFSSDTIAFRGNVGYGSNSPPSSVLHASLRHKMTDGSEPLFALSTWSLPAPDVTLHSLQALAVTTSDDVVLGDVLELKFGSELQTIQFMGRVTTFRPFGTADLHLSPNTVLEYRYATAEPDRDKGFDLAPSDVNESAPRVSMVAYSPTVEHVHHQELSLSRRIGKNNLQIAAYMDRVADPALTGVGEFTTDGGNVLPDLYSGTFTYQGSNFHAQGARLVAQRHLTSNLTGTLDYEYGGVLDLAVPNVSLAEVSQSSVVRKRQSVAGKLGGTVPKTRTRWMASYRWMNGEGLTPVDMFNASAGRADPYLSFFFRQPIPGTGFFPGHVEAIVDLRNLLAQGYVPVLGNDGHTVYLVQSARAVSGGVAFTF
jgi:Carboxypeptidase regulatory-like domain